jgi:hypothetical protein
MGKETHLISSVQSSCVYRQGPHPKRIDARAILGWLLSNYFSSSSSSSLSSLKKILYIENALVSMPKKKKENKVWEAKEKLSGAKRDEQDRIVFPSQKRWVDEDDGVELPLPPFFHRPDIEGMSDHHSAGMV